MNVNVNPVIPKMFTIQKVMRQRMTIKAFKYISDMYDFLNEKGNNDWSESRHALKAGVYAYAGGQWLNIKSIDPSALAHF